MQLTHLLSRERHIRCQARCYERMSSRLVCGFIGATAVIRQARTHPDEHPWLIQLLARRPAKVVAVALANKTARIAWAVLARGGTYRAPALAARV